jgi:hypothetical protein
MEVVRALIEELGNVGAEVGKPVVIHEVGVLLLRAGFDQHEIVNGLYRLEKDGVIELLPSNSLKLLIAFECTGQKAAVDVCSYR